jgi:GxxExxY protein
MKRYPRTYAVIGAAMEVYKTLGLGFLEAVYHEALAVEMALQKIPFIHEVKLPIIYKAETLSADKIGFFHHGLSEPSSFSSCLSC